MKITKIREVTTPSRAHRTDAGIDFFVPAFTDEFLSDIRAKNPLVSFNEEEYTLNVKPHERILIPSGVKVVVPENFVLSARNKSGVATKMGLCIMASEIDEQFRGEMHLSLVNTSNYNVQISAGQKIIQFLLQPVSLDAVEEISNEEYLKFADTERGEGGFGSTDKKK